MENPIIMAIGLDYTGDKELQNKEPPCVKTVLPVLNPLLPIRSIEASKGIRTFKNYDEAEKIIKNIYSLSSVINKSAAKERSLYFYIVLMADDDPEDKYPSVTAINILNGTIAEKQELLQNYPVRVYITGDVYKSLEPKFQDMYHSAIEVAGNELHQRFIQDAQRCFVISPIGVKDSEHRKRADYVFETYIKPACEGTPYRPVRGEMMHGSLVVPELVDALQSDPMVITYLGHRPAKYGWNPNVMLELGGRLFGNNNAPCVVIKDSTSEGKPYDLPFDLKDVRVVEIPEHEEEDLGQGAVKIRTIREAILAVIDKNPWKCLYPVANVDIKIGDSNDRTSKYTEASNELETLFELEGIAGREVLLVLEAIMEKMPECQREPFINEQQDLIGRLITKGLGSQRMYATVPIVFEKHATYPGQAFLPIIVRYFYNKITDTLRLSVVYFDVTEITEKNRDGYWVCKLVGKKRLDFSDPS